MPAVLRRLGAASLAAGAFTVATIHAQETGTVGGAVTFTADHRPVHGAVVLMVGTSHVALTDEEGRYEIPGVPPGTYELIAQREHLTADRQSVEIQPGDKVDIDFELDLSTVHEELTVTATAGGQATAFEAFNAITTLDSFELIGNSQPTLGDAIQNEPGVAKRSFGPGSSRPIIRGFDGDRVLIMEDGVRTGDLSAQSGDHGVTIDPNGLERIEIVRGPATLLYGSNAVGGVVNAITPHESYRDSLTAGTRGQFSVDAGSTDKQMGTNASVQHAENRVMLWAGGGTRRTGDYDTPVGTIANSATELSNGRAGVGYSGERLFASGGFTMDDGRFGIPFAGAFHEHEEKSGPEEVVGDTPADHEDPVFVDIDSRRRVGRFDGGMRNLDTRGIESFRVMLNIIDWEHDEIETVERRDTVGTTFDNRTFVARAEIDQRQTGRLAGKFGVWTQKRDYLATGEEALVPPTNQTSFAAFAYEELDFGRYRLQVGGRLERNAYAVAERPGWDEDEPDGPRSPEVRDRAFTGASASLGFQADLGNEAAFVTNLTHSHRAPALEELYNFGPHVGNLVFEVGNPDLDRETTLGLDMSLRYQAPRVRATVNAYTYHIDNFVFASITDDVVGQLRVADFLQADSRFMGMDAETSVRLGGLVWVNLGLGVVDAKLTGTNESLPRIPPFRGRVSVDIPYRGLTVSPELVLATTQDRVFRDETPTDGYTVLNLKASYVWARQHMAHVVSVTGYNLTDELYRNHTSFIKNLAPEIGRGVRVGYSVRFF